MDIQNLYHPILTHFRKQRMQHFFETLHITSKTKILDVGGAPWVWMIAAEHGLPEPQITILNIFPEHRQLAPNMRWIVGDGCNLPFADQEFDVVFSNSVIEHLSTHESQVAFAREVERVGRDYWVQTPDPRFFIEPHYLAPFIHWLPVSQRRKVARYGTMWGLMTHPDKKEIEDRLQEIRLIPPTEFGEMFPHAEVINERWLGMPKSLIATRQATYAA
ncbi:MAG: methyltransferase domain-containing protein [Acidobacteriaceae bacterium]